MAGFGSYGPGDHCEMGVWGTAVRLNDWKLLAEIYGTSADRLLFDPGDDLTPALMQRAHHILTTKDRAALAAWLDSGEFLPTIEKNRK